MKKRLKAISYLFLVSVLILGYSTVCYGANNTGTLVIDAIRPQSDADEFPTVYMNEAKGGLHSVATTTARDAISSARRQEGMFCYVEADQKVYQLVGGIANANWTEFQSGSSLTVKNSAGTTIVLEVDTIEFDQSTGFIVTDMTGGTVKVALGSHWKNLVIAGQDTLIPAGEETLEFAAGSNVTLTTDDSSTPKKITIAATDTNTTYSAGTGISIVGATIACTVVDTVLDETAVDNYVSDNGYLTSETDPVFSIWDKSTGISITESQISDFGAYLESESDPVFASWDKDYADLSNTPTIPSGNQIIDWTTDQGETNIHSGNYTDTNTTYSAGTGMSLEGTTFNCTVVDTTLDETAVDGFVANNGYLTSETDPSSLHLDQTTPQSFTGGDVSGSGLLKVTSGQLGLDSSTYLTSESDPVFTTWDKSTGVSITESQISDFGTYLESESDPVFAMWDKSTGISITESQISDLGAYLDSVEISDISATGTASSSTYLRGDGSWATPEGGGGAIDGSGTTNYVAKWSDTDTLADSSIFDNATSVGIGTTTPNNKLSVVGINAQISIEESDTEFLRVGVGELTETSVVGWDDADSLQLGVYSSPTDTSIDPKVTIQSDGNVGIGTTSPSNGKLVLSSTDSNTKPQLSTASLSIVNTYAADYSRGAAVKFFQTSGVDSMQSAAITSTYREWDGTNHVGGDLQFFTKKSSIDSEPQARITITNAGNVGIGTTSPESLLEVQGAEGADAIITLDADEGDDNADTWFVESDATTNDMYFRNHTSNLVTFQDGGNVGIGTTSPSVKLEVSGEVQANHFDVPDGYSYKMNDRPFVDSYDSDGYNLFIGESKWDAPAGELRWCDVGWNFMNSSSDYNVVIGYGAAARDNAQGERDRNTIIGALAASTCRSGWGVAVGYSADIGTNTAYFYNVALGAEANSDGGSGNIAIGGYASAIAGSNNISIGQMTGLDYTAAHSNKLIIDSKDWGNEDYTSALIFGDFSTEQLSIGTSTLTETLNVDGAIHLGTTAGTNNGTIRWDGTNFQGYKGGWVNLDASIATCLVDGDFATAGVMKTNGSGTYSVVDDTNWDKDSSDDLTTSATFVGDVSGTYNATSVDKIVGVSVDDTDIGNGKALIYNSTSGNLEYGVPSAAAGGSDTEVMWNNGGASDGISSLTTNGTTVTYNGVELNSQSNFTLITESTSPDTIEIAGNLSVTGTISGLQGYIGGLAPTWTSTTQVTIAPGVIHCKDKIIISSSSIIDTISNFSNGSYTYQYADYSASTSNSLVIIDSTTAPSWSDTYLGWYNGDDRCITTLYCDSASTIKEFKRTFPNTYKFASTITLMSSGNPDGAYQTLEFTAKVAPTQTKGDLAAFNSDAGTSCFINLTTTDSAGPSLACYAYGQALATGYLPYLRGFAGDLSWFGENDDDNSYAIYWAGYVTDTQTR